MKKGLEFTNNRINHIICNIKEYQNKKYANICIEKEKIDYKIMEIKDKKLLSKIMPLFIFDKKKGE